MDHLLRPKAESRSVLRPRLGSKNWALADIWQVTYRDRETTRSGERRGSHISINIDNH